MPESRNLYTARKLFLERERERRRMDQATVIAAIVFILMAVGVAVWGALA